MKGAGGGTIEKIQNKNGGSPAESIRGTAAIIFLSAAQHRMVTRLRKMSHLH